ncbi:MAG: pyridoxamine 5'-phosphate oxidase family protein [Streptococcaceae bacterium]|jgi:uncharacterized pyridoxamine 5'-phosphate oxidase family protein|nr:pyridoxamine 5'-phosphate oxidase family protein [Streptococcaceae bacterium]
MDVKIEVADLLKKIVDQGDVTLATSFRDQVSARTVSVIEYDGKIAFQTDEHSRKFKKLTRNTNVAICAHDIQLEGIANVTGTPMGNETFKDLYKKRHPERYKHYSEISSERVVEIEPKMLKLWCYENEKPHILFIDLENNIVNKIPFFYQDIVDSNLIEE